MRNGTHEEIDRVACEAGWDSFTLILLISRWVEENGHSQSLIGYLAVLAADEDSPDPEDDGDD